MRKILQIMVLVLILVLALTKSACGQEVLSIDTGKSFVIIIDEGGKKYMLEEFTQSDQLSFLEGQTLEAHFYIKRTSSNPRDTYVLEMRTDLWSAEWQYEIRGNSTRYEAAKVTVWDSPQDHAAPSFEVVLSGKVPKPAVKIEEPHFKGYTGEGPGFRDNELAVFTVFDGHDAVTKVQVVGSYAFFSTNFDIERYLDEITENLDISGLPEVYAGVLEEQKDYILTLSRTGHVGLALDLSKSYAGTVRKLTVMSPPGTNNNIPALVIAAVFAIIMAVVTGVFGYKAGQGREKVSEDVIDEMEQSYTTLKQQADKLEQIDISGVPGAEQQAAELETVKRKVSLSTAGLKNLINRLR